MRPFYLILGACRTVILGCGVRGGGMLPITAWPEPLHRIRALKCESQAHHRPVHGRVCLEVIPAAACFIVQAHSPVTS